MVWSIVGKSDRESGYLGLFGPSVSGVYRNARLDDRVLLTIAIHVLGRKQR